MKKILKIVILSFIIIGTLFSFQSADAVVNVKGYYRSNGTYVAPHVRSNPNGLKYDNYSYTPSQGLYNDSYGTRGSDWDTPTYITDPDYYTGKAIYDSQNSNSYSAPSYSYTAPTTPTCPSNSYYDTLNSNCKCNSGYIVNGSSCVYANTYCSNKYGYGAEYSSLNKNCECRYGYVWNDSVTKCISENDYCENKYGSHSGSSLGNCKCDYGYEFDGSRCINEEHNTYTTTVNCPANATAIGTNCYCISGYQINNTKTGCEKIQDTPNIKAEIKSKSGQDCPTGQMKNRMGNCDNGLDFCKIVYGQKATYNDTIKECGCATNYKLINGTCHPLEDPKPETETVSNPKIIKKEIICKIGYGLSLDKTYCVKIPEHAHYVESTTDVWLCDEGFNEVGYSCVLNKKIKTTTTIEDTSKDSQRKKEGLWYWFKSLFLKKNTI